MAAIPEEVSRELCQHTIVFDHADDAWPRLAAMAEAHGWRYRVEDAAPGTNRRTNVPHRALVWLPGGDGVATINARGRGKTEEEALARAVLKMLQRVEEGHETPLVSTRR